MTGKNLKYNNNNKKNYLKSYLNFKITEKMVLQ